MSRLVSVAKFGIASAFLRAAPVLVILAASAIYTPSEFGVIAIGVSGFAIAVSLCDAGLDSAATLIAGAGNVRSEELIGSLLAARLVVACIVSLTIVPACVMSTGLGGREMLEISVCFGVALVYMAFSATMRISLRTSMPRREIHGLAWEKGGATAIFVGALAIAPTPWVLIALYGVAHLLGSVAAMASTGMPVGGKPSFRLLRPLLAAAFPFLLSATGANVVWRFGVIYLGSRSLHDEAGHLAAAIYPIQAVGLATVAGAPLLLLSRTSVDLVRRSIRKVLLLGLLVAGSLEVGVLALYQLPEFGSVTSEQTLRIVAVLALCVPALLLNPLLGSAVRMASGSYALAAVALVSALVATSTTLLSGTAIGAAAGVVLGEAVILFLLMIKLVSNAAPAEGVLHETRSA